VAPDRLQLFDKAETAPVSAEQRIESSRYGIHVEARLWHRASGRRRFWSVRRWPILFTTAMEARGGDEVGGSIRLRALGHTRRADSSPICYAGPLFSALLSLCHPDLPEPLAFTARREAKDNMLVRQQATEYRWTRRPAKLPAAASAPHARYTTTTSTSSSSSSMAYSTCPVYQFGA
jgi:hypothetical protein